VTDEPNAQWRAPASTAPVDAVVYVPGSKSLTNRLLVLAAISGSPTTIRNPLHARDTMLMAQALRALGVGGRDVDDPEPGAARGWVVEPRPMLGPATIDCGLAGTVMRFVPPLAALADGPVAFDGDPRARERPMGPILQALRDLGVRVDAAAGDRLPFATLGNGRVAGGRVSIDASASSQFVSALLLVGCRFDDGIEVASTTAVPSLPHVRMTVDLLRRAGIVVDEIDARTWRVHPGVPDLHEVVVEPDLSNAMPFIAAALVTGGSVLVPGWPADALQPDAEVRALIERLGGSISVESAGLRVTGGPTVNGGELDLSDLGELVPTVTAVALRAAEPTTISGVAHLRGHETDRLAALVSEIRRLGGDAEETPDGLVIRPTRLSPGTWRTYDDHRMATAGAIVGLSLDGVVVENIATTEKTLPGFPALWTTMLAQESTA
jgi:3-phosphoshikimate 1-carboxyvinyltransferase